MEDVFFQWESNTPANASKRQMSSQAPQDDEPDEWDRRIINTGCAAENEALLLCHYDTQDWRKCIKEMNAFKACWAAFNNNERTQTKDNDTRGF